jgi:predicted nucleotidyltransferase component of viral defense system
LALKKTNASDIYDTFDLKERKRKEIKLWLSMNEFGLTLVEVHLLVQ